MFNYRLSRQEKSINIANITHLEFYKASLLYTSVIQGLKQHWLQRSSNNSKSMYKCDEVVLPGFSKQNPNILNSPAACK